MYGLIHRAMRDMVLERLGQAAWQAIEIEQAIGPGELISMTVYDDALTMRLMGALATTLDLPMPQMLHAFGRHWVDFVYKGAYGSIMHFTGSDLVTLLRNLDRMHHTVRITLPAAIVPSFVVIDVSPEAICVEYRSEREGLETMVEGLLEGLIERFGLKADIAPVNPGVRPARFMIHLHPATAPIDGAAA